MKYASMLSNMKHNISLDDLTLFVAVAEAGGLAGAVASTRQSAPTLSRKMTGVERHIQRRLFLRGPKGYALTSDGRALLDELRPLLDIRRKLENWASENRTFTVRITAGRWTSRWLAKHMRAFWSESEPWVPELVSSNAVLDVARREVDFGFRNTAPDQPWLAARKTRRLSYAEFASDPAVTGVIAVSNSEATTRSTRWVRAQCADRIVTTVNDVLLTAEMAKQGVGRAVLPIFVGESEPGLVQVSDPIDDLTHDEWLVTHHDARHDPPVRRAIDAVTKFVTQGTL